MKPLVEEFALGLSARSVASLARLVALRSERMGRRFRATSVLII